MVRSVFVELRIDSARLSFEYSVPPQPASVFDLVRAALAGDAKLSREIAESVIFRLDSDFLPVAGLEVRVELSLDDRCRPPFVAPTPPLPELSRRKFVFFGSR